MFTRHSLALFTTFVSVVGALHTPTAHDSPHLTNSFCKSNVQMPALPAMTHSSVSTLQSICSTHGSLSKGTTAQALFQVKLKRSKLVMSAAGSSAACGSPHSVVTGHGTRWLHERILHLCVHIMAMCSSLRMLCEPAEQTRVCTGQMQAGGPIEHL